MKVYTYIIDLGEGEFPVSFIAATQGQADILLRIYIRENAKPGEIASYDEEPTVSELGNVLPK